MHFVGYYDYRMKKIVKWLCCPNHPHCNSKRRRKWTSDYSANHRVAALGLWSAALVMDEETQIRLYTTTAERTKRKSCLSLKWEDFFGSTLDLSTSVEKGWETICTTDIDIDSPDHSPPGHTEDSGTDSPEECSPETSCVPEIQVSDTGTPVCDNCDHDDLDSIASLHTSGCATLRASGKRPLSQVSISSSSTSSLPRHRSKKMAGLGTTLDSSSSSMDVQSSESVNAIHSTGAMSKAASDPAVIAVETSTKVVDELLDTEALYLKSLEEVEEGYVHRMKSEKSFDDNIMDVIFCNLSDICAFHRRFLEELQRSRKDLGRMSKCFINNAETFQLLYGKYCTNYSYAMGQLEDIRRLHLEMWEFLLTCQTSLQHQLPLATYLLKPVQRILKYQLLLQELCKALLKSSGQLNGDSPVGAIRAGLDCMAAVADQINEQKRAHDDALRVRELRERLRSALRDVDDLGELVLDDEFRLPGKKEPRMVLLFHKAMLIVKSVVAAGGGYLGIKSIIRCANLMLIESIPKDPLSFHVLPFDNPKCQQTLQARTTEQKRLWCREIKRLILDNYDAAIPERAKHIVLNMTDLLQAPPGEPMLIPAAMIHPPAKPIRKPGSNDQLDGGPSSGPSSPAPITMRRRGSTEPDLLSTGSPRAMSRSFSSTDDLHTLDEAWNEIVARHTSSNTFVASLAVEEGDRVTSGGGEWDGNSAMFSCDDDDFRCIAVEINMERCGLDSTTNAGSGSATAASTNLTPGNTNGNTGVTYRNGTGGPGARSRTNPSTAASLYIDCPSSDTYDKVTFGRTYEQYIEKTRTKIALSPKDFDEIFRPLRELAETNQASTGSEDEEEDLEGRECQMEEKSHLEEISRLPQWTQSDREDKEGSSSSGGSSPRHIVSRIAVHHSSASLASTLGRKSSLDERPHSPPGYSHTLGPGARSNSKDTGLSRVCAGDASTGAGSRKKGQDSSGGSTKKFSLPGVISRIPRDKSSTSLDATLGEGAASGKSTLVQSVTRFFRAYTRNSKREKKQGDAEDEAGALVVTGLKGSREELDLASSLHPSKTAPGRHRAATLEPLGPVRSRPLQHSASVSGADAMENRGNVFVSPAHRKKARAPPPPPATIPDSNGVLDDVASEKQQDALSDVDVCRGRVRSAMTNLIESLPFADDSEARTVKSAQSSRPKQAAPPPPPMVRKTNDSSTGQSSVSGRSQSPPAGRLRGDRNGSATSVGAGKGGRGLARWHSDRVTSSSVNGSADGVPKTFTSTTRTGFTSSVGNSSTVSTPQKPPRRQSSGVSNTSQSTFLVTDTVGARATRGTQGGKSRAPPPPVVVSQRSGLLSQSQEKKNGPLPTATEEPNEEEEAMPPRGLVKNMVNRFQPI